MRTAFEDNLVRLYQGDIMEVLRSLPDATFQAVISSPPYYALRDYGLPTSIWGGDPDCSHKWQGFGTWTFSMQRDGAGGQFFDTRGEQEQRRGTAGTASQGQMCETCYAWEGCHGLEPTPELWAFHEVLIFRELRRVLRDDGTIWWNVGDSYSGSGGAHAAHHANPGMDKGAARAGNGAARPRGGDPLQLLQMPDRLALALQGDGWLLRSKVIWAKGASFDDTSGSVMPESVSGTRWERHRVKGEMGMVECHGCDDCKKNAGLVLRRGSGRPTTAYETILLLAKQPGYFYDTEAVREETRNLRNVWRLNLAGYKEAHFATFPERLVEPMIKASTPLLGSCSECGAPTAPYVRKSGGSTGTSWHDHEGDMEKGQRSDGRTSDGTYTREVMGYRPTCECPRWRTQPPLVLDPFAGSATTLAVARKLGCKAVGIELSEEYVRLAAKRLGQGVLQF